MRRKHRTGRPALPPTLDSLPELATVAELAAPLRVGTGIIYSLIKTGELPAVKIGRFTRVHRDDARAYIERQRQAAR